MDQPLSIELIKRLGRWPNIQESVMSLAIIKKMAEQSNSEVPNEDEASESLDEENPALEGHFLTERSAVDSSMPDSCSCKCHRDQQMTFELSLPFSCSKCSQQFCCKCQFLVHREFHRGERKYACHVCGKAYYYKSDLVRHQPVHSEIKPHVCKVCGRSFNQVGHLITHRLVHTGEKPFPCDICNKPFNRKSNLQKHKMIHTGERPFECVICGSRFSRKGDLQRHTMLHTGERPYKCDICEKSFSQKPHLISHTAVHTGERPYKCLACGRSFNRKNHLLKHQLEKCPELSLKRNDGSDLTLNDFSSLSSNSFFNNFNNIIASKADTETSNESSTVEKSYFESIELKPKLKVTDIVPKSNLLPTPSNGKSDDTSKPISETSSLLRARLCSPVYARSSNNKEKKSNEPVESQAKTVPKLKIKSEIGDDSFISEDSSELSIPSKINEHENLAEHHNRETDKEEVSRNEVAEKEIHVSHPSSNYLNNNQPSCLQEQV